ncbi:MAG: regulatory protein RecX [Clostridia bacterium]
MDEEKLKELEEFDKLKTKVLKYILYKKRTEQEVRQKFAENTGNLLDNVIEYLKQENYINDTSYIEKSISEIQRLKNLSIKEVKYKLLTKGLSSKLVDEYIYEHKEEMLEYEINSAKTILIKKTNTMEKEDILGFLRKKGYMEETIRIIGEDYE